MVECSMFPSPTPPEENNLTKRKFVHMLPFKTSKHLLISSPHYFYNHITSSEHGVGVQLLTTVISTD